MAKIRHYIDKTDYGEPRNWRDLEITIDWLKKVDTGAINVSDLSFAFEAKTYLTQRILNGISGGIGIFEGEPYKIVVGDQENPEFVFDGYLDFTEDMTVIGEEELVCSLKKTKGQDWLNDVADSFSFAYLYDQGVVTNSDFVRVPYVINYIPDGMQVLILSMSIYMMTKELIENVEKLAETVADIANASTPVVGVSVGIGAGAVTAWDLGDWVMVALKALARIAYIIAMTVAIINLIDEVINQFLPKKRYHIGMSFKRMFERGCQHLGMTFQSTIPELDWIHIPRKDKKGGSSGERGFPSNSEPIYVFGDLIREMKKKFNADYRIKNNVFIFERQDKFKYPSPYQMPDFFVDQDRLLDPRKHNADEIIANYNIYWALDIQDQNTLDVVDGRVFQAITSPIATKNTELVVIKGLAEIQIPFSMGLRKDNLTTVEKILKTLASVVDGLTGIFGGGTNYGSRIEARVGSLLMSSHFLTSGKVVKMSGSRLAMDQRTILDARQLWENYHFINSFALYNGIHNQYLRFEKQPVPMTIEEFAILMENNQATDAIGNEYEIEKVVYNPYKTTALIDYRVKKLYTNNLKVTFH